MSSSHKAPSDNYQKDGSDISNRWIDGGHIVLLNNHFLCSNHASNRMYYNTQ